MKEDAAEFVYEQLGDCILGSYTGIMELLENRFGERSSKVSPNSYLAQLETIKLGAKQTLAAYTADIRKLVLKGYPTAESQTRLTQLSIGTGEP